MIRFVKIRLQAHNQQEPAQHPLCISAWLGCALAVLSFVLLAVPNDADATCSGACTEEQAITGLVSPPEWAEGRQVHFEPESVEASAYTPEELNGEVEEGAEGEGGPLLYHEAGKGVQHTPKLYLIFWGSNFASGEKGKEVHSMLLKLAEGLTGSAYEGLLTQYFDSTSRISSTVTANSYIDESVTAPSSVNELAVEEEVTRAINANGWKSELTAQFMVLTAPGSTYQTGFPANACAYHGVTTASSKVTAGVVYDFVPYQGDPRFEGCLSIGNPSKNPVFKTSKSASHEYAESATDPEPGSTTYAWRAASGAEIADICQSISDFELPSGAYAQYQYDDHLNSCANADLEPPHVYAVTESASSVKSSEATLNGIVNAEGLSTNVYFEYGTTKSYGSKTAEASAGSGVSNQSTTKAIAGLSPSTVYHYRLVGVNSTGTTSGEDHTVTTPKATPPTVVTGSASGVTSTEATMNGTVNPNGFSTTYQFEYGRTTSYGTAVPVPAGSAGSGTTEVAKSYLLTGLLPSTTYYFRLKGSSSEGTTFGKEGSFRTEASPPTFSSNFGSSGTGNGQFKEPTGIGVNPINGTVVVSDEGNNRVEEFNEKGEYILQFGSKGTGNGQFTEPRGLAVDSQGNVWVTDTGNNRVEKFNEKGEYLSQFGTKGSGNGQLSSPKGIAVDSKGNLWVADSGNNRVEEFNEKGEYLRQFSAGAGPIGVAVDAKGNVWSDNENETGAIEEHNEKGEFVQKFASRGSGNGQVHEPKRLAVDADGYVWVPDAANNRVEVFNEKGEYVTKFGTFGSGSEQMNYPVGLALDPRGNVWITDNNNRVDVWKLPSPFPPTFSSNFGSKGTGNGQFTGPCAIAVSPVNGIVAVVDEVNNRVEVFNEKGEYILQFGSKGTGNGQFTEPRGIAVDPKGNIWVSDRANNRVEEFNEKGEYLSQFGSKGSGNGQLNSPKGIAVDSKGNLWVADSANGRVEEFNEKGEYLSKFSAGTTPVGVAIDSKGNVWSDGFNETGAIEEHNEKGELVQKFASIGEGNGQVHEPKRLAVDADGYVWVPDAANNRVEVFNEKGEYVTKFGTKGSGSEQMGYLGGVAVDPRGNIWIADEGQNRVDVWKLPSPFPPTFSSNFGSKGTGNGQFTAPGVVAVSPVNGIVVVVDEGNNRVEEFNEKGEYILQFGSKGTGNGQFTEPRGAAVDSKGNIWVSDRANNRVEEFNEKGEYLSQFGTKGSGNGQLNSPKGIAVDSKDNLWVADSANGRVEEFNEKGEYLSKFSAGNTPVGVAIDSKGNVWSDSFNETGAIEEHNEKGELVQKFASIGEDNGQVHEPKRLAVDADGYVWVPDAANNRVEVFNEKGEYVTKFGTFGTGSEQMKFPVGVAIDPRGNIWIADENNNRVDVWIR